jgi:anti-sigma factor RsiW
MVSRKHRYRPSERDLVALADGSLEPARRARVERAVAGSPELQRELRDQRYAVAAVRVATAERAPAGLRARLAPARPSRRPARRVGALAAGAMAATAATLVLTLGGGPDETATVADAAVFAMRAPAVSVPQGLGDMATLESPKGAGLPFPDWQEHFGWKAVGARHDRLDGRSATTVFYRRRNQVIAYTILGGGPLPVRMPARLSVRNGTVLHSLAIDGRSTVTWLRRGHTCVLSGTRTNDVALLRLAAWRGRGELPF